jgi:timeless
MRVCSRWLKYFIQIYNTYFNISETIKDLIRYLRRDDESHEIRRYLGEAKILQSDLLPILRNFWEKEDLFDVILRCAKRTFLLD